MVLVFIQVKLVNEKLSESLKTGILKDDLRNFSMDQPGENIFLLDAPELLNQIGAEQVIIGQASKNSSQIYEPVSLVSAPTNTLFVEWHRRRLKNVS